MRHSLAIAKDIGVQKTELVAKTQFLYKIKAYTFELCLNLSYDHRDFFKGKGCNDAEIKCQYIFINNFIEFYVAFLWPASMLPGVTKTGRAISASAAPVATVTAVKAENKQYRAINASAAPVATVTTVKAEYNQYRAINSSAAPVATVTAFKAENNQYRAIRASAAPAATVTAVKAETKQYRAINASAAPVATVTAFKAGNN